METKCHGCLNPMWTRDPTAIWEKGGMCEECSYLLITDRQIQQRRSLGRSETDGLFRRGFGKISRDPSRDDPPDQKHAKGDKDDESNAHVGRTPQPIIHPGGRRARAA